MVGRVQDIILAAGKSWRAGNGEAMRRRFQTGSVRKRGTRSPVWEDRYYEPVLVAGKLQRVRRAMVLGSCSEITKSEAKRKFREILRPLNDGIHSPVQAMTFVDFCARWKREILVNYRPSTRYFHEATLDRWIVPHFRDWSLGDIKTPDLQHFVNRYREYSQSVLKHPRATEAELSFRRSAINLLEETVFGVHNQTLTDANGSELEERTLPIAATH